MKDLVLGGRYRVDRVLGRGGMGAVVAAHDEVRDVAVAIKLLDDARHGDPASRERFAREAELGARLTSPRTARVLDRSSEPPYFVMEYLEGTTLERTVDARGPLGAPSAVSIALQILEALAELHAIGFVHADVTPGNVLLLGTPPREPASIKLLDLGLASPIGERASGGGGGTLAFLAPEQARGEPLDARTDLYGLSATLHRALTGNLVFPVDPIGTFFDALTSAPRPRAGVDDALDAVLVRGLAASPDHRWPSASDYARALSGWLDRQPQ